MNYIVKVVDDNGEIRLMVNCWHCHRTPIISEDDTFCSFCMNEIEEVNIGAWTEYEYNKPQVDITI